MKKSIIILKKELLELFRDKTSIFILLMPIFIFPIFNLGLNTLNNNSNSTINICLQTDSKESENLFGQFILENKTLRVHIIDSSQPETLLQNGNIACYINISGRNIDFIYNSNSYSSLLATTKLGDSFQQFYNSVLSKSENNIFQLNLKNENYSSIDTASSISSIFIPILLLILVLKSAITFSSDLFAGEKERRTLELLLLSGVNRNSIYFGKTLALFLFSLFSLISSFTGFFISSFFTQSSKSQFKFLDMGNPVFNFISIILCLIFLSIITVFLTSTVSMLSKNIRGAQSLNNIILLTIFGLTVLVILGNTQNNLFKFIPILNLILCFINSFSGIITELELLLSLITNSLFLILLVLVGTKYITTEKFLN